MSDELKWRGGIRKSSVIVPAIRVAFAIGICGASALAQESAEPPSRRRAAFDPTTGRDLLNYPPHRSADILHERIELEIADMNTPRMSGTATIRFTPIGSELSVLALHASELFIRQVSSDGRTVRFSASPGDDHLDLTFEPPVPFGQTAEVRIEYEVNDPAEGIVWTPESPLWPGRPASFHSQGESEFNRSWFPTFDFPSERLTSEIIATVPSGFQAVSNGHLVSHESAVFQGTGSAAERWHWLQDKEHAPYLISLDVGKWDVVDVSMFGSRLPMPVYAPPGQGKQVKKVFGRTPRMISLYERLFDEPYPWDKYAQVIVTNFAWGGMENTSATTLYDTMVLDETALLDGDEDELICHELAHQWFGDLLTCKSWEHIWLNEGWATYSEALWQQYKEAGLGGKPSGAPTAGLKSDNDAYQYAIWKNFREVIDNDKADAPFQPAMVSKEYAEPDAVFDREANPYPKGSAILHMLREQLTDPIFWRAAALYVDRHRNQPVETFQFRLCMEEIAGQSLQRFFDQWCYRPGVPKLKVTTAWDAAGSSLGITVEQLQNIDGPNPAFAFELPVWVDDGAAGGRTVAVPCETRSVTRSFKLAREPRRIVVDPDLGVLADVDLVQDSERFVETLRTGPTLAAKLQAVRHLAKQPGDRGIEALAAAARDNRAYYGLRIDALQALGELANPAGDPSDAEDEPVAAADATQPVSSATSSAPKPNPNPEALAALMSLSRADFSDARIRESLVKQLGIAAAATGTDRSSQKPVIEFLLSRWSKDRSYDVRAECLRSLGRLKAVDGMKALAEGLKTESQHDQIRQGAIDGLKLAAFPDALDQILPMTLASRRPGTRQSAVKAAGKLVAQDPERVFNVLSALINDTELRTRRVAVETLLDLPDPRAELTVDQWASGARSRSDQRWARELMAKQAADGSP